jgi:hypothetical protein
LISARDYSGDADELADAIGNVQFSISTDGDLQSTANGTTGKIIGDPDLNGIKFLVLGASINSSKQYNSPLGIGHKTTKRKLDYYSFDQGNGTGEYRADAIGTAPATASASSNSDAKGEAVLELTDDLDYVWDSTQDFGTGYGPTTFHTDEKDNSKTTLKKTYTGGGNAEATLKAEDTLEWSGSASDSNTFKVE